MFKIALFILALFAALWNNASVAGLPSEKAQTLEDARAIVQQQSGGGRILGIEETKDGYRVKILTTSGKVLFIFVERR